jgi:NAD(P)-dependent dehydrogenase (short-subunit alcohol dehydrogenase family)
MTSTNKKKFYIVEAEKAAKQGTFIQKEVDAKDKEILPKARAKVNKPSAMQAGAREYPESFPKQHHSKPGLESELNPAPMCEAPYYKGSEKLKDKVALITGGDSGIGRSVAILYAREGADIAIVYLNEHEDADETKRLVEAEGQRCVLMVGDVANPLFCEDAVQKTIDELGALDILVNNAAFQEHVENFEDLTEEHFDRTLKTNLYGYFHMAKAAVPRMKYGSSIVMTGSITGIEGNKHLLDYSMTKGGIHSFARSLSANLMDKGIRVNVVAPDKQAEQVATFGSTTPMGRAAQPEEIAPAYVFLAAPCCSSYITGEVLPIIGGYKGG